MLNPDPSCYVADRRGPWIISLKLPALAGDLADELRAAGETLTPAAADKRGRVWYHHRPKSTRHSPKDVGQILFRLFQTKYSLPLSGGAEDAATWTNIGQRVAVEFTEVRSSDVYGFIAAHCVPSHGENLQRPALLASVLATFPGIPEVRGKEITEALIDLGFVAQETAQKRPMVRINGERVRVWPNLKFVQ